MPLVIRSKTDRSNCINLGHDNDRSFHSQSYTVDCEWIGQAAGKNRNSGIGACIGWELSVGDKVEDLEFEDVYAFGLDDNILWRMKRADGGEERGGERLREGPESGKKKKGKRRSSE